MSNENSTGNVGNSTNPSMEGASSKSGKGKKPAKGAVAPQVTAPAGYVAGPTCRVEPSATSTVPAGEYVIYTGRNAAGKETRRIFVGGVGIVVKKIGDRFVSCKPIEKTGLHVNKNKGEKVRVDLRGLREALAAFQEAGGNAEAEVASLASTLTTRAKALTEQKVTLASIQAQVAERVRAALAAGQDMTAILAALAAPTEQPSA